MELHKGPTAAEAISYFEWKPVAQMYISIYCMFWNSLHFCPRQNSMPALSAPALPEKIIKFPLHE